MIDRGKLREEIVRVFEGDADGVAFHGPSTRSNLEGITHQLAAARPIQNGHSIWELVSHLEVGREWSVRRLKGEKPDIDWWPPVAAQSPQDWQASLSRLSDVQSRFLSGLEAAKDEDAAAAARFLIHHELYHSGQIAILRRALGLDGRPG